MSKVKTWPSVSAHVNTQSSLRLKVGHVCGYTISANATSYLFLDKLFLVDVFEKLKLYSWDVYHHCFSAYTVNTLLRVGCSRYTSSR